MYYESSVFLKVYERDLGIFNDDKSLLPIHSSLGIARQAWIHQVATFYASDDAPYFASRSLCEGRYPCAVCVTTDHA
jgi:NADH:ubiquinone oxidoreductase subunit E